MALCAPAASPCELLADTLERHVVGGGDLEGDSELNSRGDRLNSLDEHLETIVLGVVDGDVEPCLTRNGETRAGGLTSDLTVDARLDDDGERFADQTALMIVGVLAHGLKTSFIGGEAVDVIVIDDPVDDGRRRRIIDTGADSTIKGRRHLSGARCDAHDDLRDAVLVEEIGELSDVVDVLDGELVYGRAEEFIASTDEAGVREDEVAIGEISAAVRVVEIHVRVHVITGVDRPLEEVETTANRRGPGNRAAKRAACAGAHTHSAGEAPGATGCQTTTTKRHLGMELAAGLEAGVEEANQRTDRHGLDSTQ